MLARIQTSAQFACMLRGGAAHAAAKTLAQSAHFALHALADAPGVLGMPKPPSIGVVAPKRLAKRAVTRNTIKRQIYAVSAALHPQLPRSHFVVRLRAQFSTVDFPSASSAALKRSIRAELEQLFAKASV